MADIAVVNANKSFGNQHILRDVGLTIASGDFVVLLGPSGCGKSTLLNAIAGLEDLDTGQVVVDGKDMTDVDSSQRGMSMVFQSYALYPTMTVRRNLSFGLKVNRMPKAEIDRRVAWAAGLLQIEPLLDRKPSQLSGGQRQRVAIGRALVRRGSIFLFDEPLSNLDAKLRNEMRLEIKRLHHELKSTIVYVTHDQIEAMTLATHVAVMKGGKIEQFAAPAMLYEKPATLFVAGFVGSPAMNLLPATIEHRDGRIAARLAGTTVNLVGYAFEAEPVDGQEVVLGLRPEDIVVADAGSSGTGVDASLVFLEPMGADTLAWFDTAGGERLSVRLSSPSARSMPGTVRLVVDPARASIFSRETEHRL
jgi:multiple sugar transport system ATP-binding protein